MKYLDYANFGAGELVVIILFCILIFLAIRELLCWYYKINKMVKIQQAILVMLTKQHQLTEEEQKWVNKLIKD